MWNHNRSTQMKFFRKPSTTLVKRARPQRLAKSLQVYVLFFSVFLVAYSYGLDGSVRFTYQSEALSKLGTSAQHFGHHCDLLCRRYHCHRNIQEPGGILWRFCVVSVWLYRSRLFFSYIPALPFLINAWITGNVVSAVLGSTSWRWGIGMWAIIFPVMVIPLLFSLVDAELRAHRRGLLRNIPSPFKAFARRSLWTDIFWQIDIIGLLLLAAVLALILLPFTLAGGVGNIWRTARVIAPLVVGFVVALPLFVFWEMKIAKQPLLPFKILMDRQILAPLLIAMLLNTAWYTQGDYLYYTLLVAFDRNTISATRVQNIYSFCSVVIGVCIGLIARKVRRLKYFIVAGTLLFVLAFGLLIRYRGGYSLSDFAGLVASEVILGIAGGMFPYPAQVMIQSAVQHERTAVVTSLYLASYSVGSALGNTIAAAIWTNTMPSHLLNALNRAGLSDASTLQTLAYQSPLTFIQQYHPGTPAREAVGHAYREVQRYLTITGICISTLLVLLSLCLRNPRLGDEQSLPEAEKFDEKDSSQATLDMKDTDSTKRQFA
ncbi:uncharacterized protein L203_104751 [Cryptococcus depauperatus CBS 7841]|uniref:MFS transporter, SIT family, siderophore-iron:H+ symporter n=1 Tax=Cryptococcus depauperatus CBS 7841 TaxID=1295531 RepID=A0AAJ8JW14_9TREE